MNSNPFPVDAHVHTLASGHAYSTLLECVAYAGRNGVRLLAVTDHGPALPGAPHPWHFLNMRVLPRHMEGVGLLRGIEANILNEEGATDYPEDIWGAADIVLAGIHAPVFPHQGVEACTAAVVEAIRGGRVHVITHPGNPLFPVRPEEVAREAARHGVALEVNNASLTRVRKGSREPCLELLRAARAAGGWIIFGSDAHFAPHIGCFAESIELVRQIGFPEDRILSASPRRLLDFLETRTGRRIVEFDAVFGA
jgi:putative hydrolase